ncbi:MAG: phosphate ABC transporter ATP-binding protein PstB [Vreelandella alkaliphila]|uniref:Phosphate ABC transporter ATP-binding protein n=1 Tax=Halomonas campaniensis TaxID=213554 RepID=A0A3D0KCI2_9GAMM|nr:MULTISPECIES: phosphate ABC transporter ATP-binding protein PstB [unclassified Halomonas]HBP40929.1 phosphate ABC transporter ATP-binding protein [Halomonas sp.]HBS83096.1 phosphate ABC transporter ATP-binding protein [Halomonas campaniensis]ASK21130.1 phosphate ABC transporter ATP-binding protein [Halomonas sp. N3-2A]UTD56903.1 phosphate ABC transporter ATP-binding protein PstB [Halomonas sp. MS1]WKD28276.1 phosphate ABC transporter ATP-binding protein PstB [Halomonas sp. KG2]
MLASLSSNNAALAPVARFSAEQRCLSIAKFHLAYAGKMALRDLTLDLPRHRVTAFIGPSGCGKSTLLRAINRLHDLNESVTHSGHIQLEGQDIHAPDMNVTELRRRVGMVFQTPNPFPMSIYENVAFGLRLQQRLPKRKRDDIIEWALTSAALWDEVKDRLHRSAWQLSGGQQQRLVIARTLAVQPDVLLLDEPASALDPISTLKIEELIRNLKSQLTLVLVTHNMQQAARVSDYTAFLQHGELVEYGPTDQVFTNPRLQRTENYITGRIT